MKMLSRQRPLPSIDIRVPIRFSRSVQAKEVNCDPWTPFCLSSSDPRCVDVFLAPHDDAEDFARDVALHHADGFQLGMTFGDAARDVGSCPFVGPEAADRDDVQRAVGSAVSAAVESVPHCLSG